MKLRLALVVALSSTVLLSGCSALHLTTPTGTPAPATADPAHNVLNAPDTDVFVQTLPDGRKVTCISAEEVNGGGGISCDWADMSKN